jgi:hypothetical protein
MYEYGTTGLYWVDNPLFVKEYHDLIINIAINKNRIHKVRIIPRQLAIYDRDIDTILVVPCDINGIRLQSAISVKKEHLAKRVTT